MSRTNIDASRAAADAADADRVRRAALEVVRAAGMAGKMGSVTIHLAEGGEPKQLESRTLRKL